MGNLVFYRNERRWIDGLLSPESQFCRVRDTRIFNPGPGGHVSTLEHVPIATLLKAQTQGIRYGQALPTVASEARKLARKAGQRDVGDDVAAMLRGKSIPELYQYAAPLLGTTPEALDQKYSHLDNGRRRMVIGNRLRSLK